MVMAKLLEKDVEHVAKLSKLDLTQEEIVRFGKQLSDVLDYFKELSGVDVANIEPTSQTTGLVNIYRKDEVKINTNLSVEEATSGSEKIYNNYFEVNALIDKSK